MAGHIVRNVVKRTTGVTGLAVHPQPLEALQRLYGETLEQLKKLPESASYRKETEMLTTERLGIVSKGTNIGEVERGIGFGQIEEAIKVAENELRLVHRMHRLRPWEDLIEKAPEGQWANP